MVQEGHNVLGSGASMTRAYAAENRVGVPAAPKSEIDSLCAELNEAVQHLEKVAEILSERLKPVSLQDATDPINKMADNPRPALSPLGYEIEARICHVKSVRQKLQKTTERLSI